MNAADAHADLVSVARELLAQSEGRGVLGVCAANLDDVFEGFCLGFEARGEFFKAGQEHIMHGHGRCDVHGCWEGVV